jgi:hypothetical protein
MAPGGVWGVTGCPVAIAASNWGACGVAVWRVGKSPNLLFPANKTKTVIDCSLLLARYVGLNAVVYLYLYELPA